MNRWIPLAVVVLLALVIAAFIISGFLGDDGGGGMDMDHGARVTGSSTHR
jgi:hypothetical protein